MTPPVAAMMRFLLPTGCRVSEARLMSWQDIDRTSSPWRYEPPHHKTSHNGKRRDRRKRRCRSDRLMRRRALCSAPGVVLNKPYTLAGLGASVRRACERAEVSIWSPGQLRHNFATEVRSRFDIDAARIVLGHSESSTTEICAERDVRRAAEIANTVR